MVFFSVKTKASRTTTFVCSSKPLPASTKKKTRCPQFARRHDPEARGHRWQSVFERRRKEVTMESDAQPEKRQAHAYLDRLSEAQLSAVRGLLEAMLDPAARALANAPVDDEPITEEEVHAVAEARESRKRNGGIPFKEVVAEPVTGTR
jgi:hypothetical protein